MLGIADELAEVLQPDDPSGARVEILALLAQLVGTLQLARALTDRDLADQLLAEATRSIQDGLDRCWFSGRATPTDR